MKKITLTFLSLFLLSACQNTSPQSNKSEQLPCTMEAKLCPDGSSVGRVGPQCEFAECSVQVAPEFIPMDIKDWKTSIDEESGITFKYPDSLPTPYIEILAENDFLPTVKISEAVISCEDSEVALNTAVATQSKTIDGEPYCLKIEGGAAAGSNYNTYTYSTHQNDKLITLKFTLRQVNCGNYDDPQKIECEQEQADFNPDNLAIQILKTVSF